MAIGLLFPAFEKRCFTDYRIITVVLTTQLPFQISTNAKEIMVDVNIVVSMLRDHIAVTAILDGSLGAMEELAIVSYAPKNQPPTLPLNSLPALYQLDRFYASSDFR